MAFQALYRRYRPQRFGEVKGQDHVVAALRNAVRDEAVGHAYLFSGPRGTGKTSTARILAKALNCEDLDLGEPCGACEPCRAVEAGTSLAVTELDAASNNGVDAVRDLIQRASLGTTGRTKVYIVDEVHMLSAAASNALLKTLEEPPGHVVFVLATTDPHKVLPTIRSRTQHYDFRLIGAAVLGDHLREVASAAGLDVSDVALDRAVRKGDGSARDALSALDQIVAAGGDGDDDASVDEIVEGLCDRDTARALGGVALACGTGADPRSVASAVAAHLRDALLSLMAPDLVSLPDSARERVADQARRLGAPALVRALDAVGDAVLALPNAPDPRVTLEVSLVKVTRPEADTSPGALLERLERLERGAREATTAEVGATSPLAAGGGGPAPTRAPGSGPQRRPAAGPGEGAGGPDHAPPSTGQQATRAAAAGTDGAPAQGSSLPPSPTPTTPASSPDALPAGAATEVHGATVEAADRSSRPSASSASAAGAREALAAARTKTGERAAQAPAPSTGRKAALGAIRTTGAAPSAARPPDVPSAPVDPSEGATPSGAPPAAVDPTGASGAGADDPRSATGGPLPALEELVAAWSTQVLPRLTSVSKGRFSTGRFADVADGAAVLALPNAIMRDKCEEKRPELEDVLGRHFGRPVPVRLVVEAAANGLGAGSRVVADGREADDQVDLDGLVDAPADDRTGIDRLTEAFPGAEVLDGG